MPPKLPDFANISERLRKALRLEHRIVVIGLSDTPPANLPHYEGEPLKACQMLDTVRFEGKSFYTVQNDHYECKNAIRWLGFDESYEGHFSGEWATGDYPDNGRALFRAPAFSRRMYEESPKVRVGTVKCAYYMPLEKANEGPARGDEVAIFVLNPRQAMYLARGTLYSRGGICYGMTGPGTCQSVIAGPFCTRQPMYSLGCFGARQFMKITGNEMWFGVPIEQLALLADDVELLLERRPDLKAQMDEPFDQVHVVNGQAGLGQRGLGAGAERGTGGSCALDTGNGHQAGDVPQDVVAVFFGKGVDGRPTRIIHKGILL